MMFAPALIAKAELLISACRAHNLKIITAESCTGGLLAGLITSIPGASDAYDSGLVTYSNQAKMDLLGVPADILKVHGAVSEQTARAMAEGALRRGNLALAVTGIAGPGGGTAEKPVGLVHIAVAARGDTRHKRLLLGDIGREEIRLRSIAEILDLAHAVQA